MLFSASRSRSTMKRKSVTERRGISGATLTRNHDSRL